MTAAELVALVFVRASLIVALAAAVVGCWKRAPAAARHCVWAGALGAILVLPVAGFALPHIRVPILSAGIERCITQPLGPDGSSLRRDAHAGGVPRGDPSSMGRGQPGVTARGGRLTWLMGMLWLIGFTGFAARRLAASRRVNRLLRRARPLTDVRLQRLFSRAVLSAGSRANSVSVRVSDDIAVPATAGVIRHVILLPSEIAQRSDEEVRGVLAHELAHVVRRDGVFNLLADLAAIVYWCNPLVRIAARRMKSESEHDCDDRVLRSGIDSDAYARLLLDVARHGGVASDPPEPAMAMSRAPELESRLRSILDPRRSRQPLRRRMSAGLVMGAVICALPAAAVSTSESRGWPSAIVAPEPDRAGDALADPGSERLPAPAAARVSAGAADALAGPDSVLARRLVAALNHVPDHPGDLVRDRAAWALAQTRDGRLMEPLLSALEARDWRVCSYAAWSLAGSSDPRLVPQLLQLLQHPIWRARAMAAYAIRVSADPRARAGMSAALTDAAWQVRVEAVEYFGATGRPSDAELVEPRLVDRHAAVRLAAEQTLVH